MIQGDVPTGPEGVHSSSEQGESSIGQSSVSIIESTLLDKEVSSHKSGLTQPKSSHVDSADAEGENGENSNATVEDDNGGNFANPKPGDPWFEAAQELRALHARMDKIDNNIETVSSSLLTLLNFGARNHG